MKHWKLKPAESMGLDISPASISFPKHDDGYIVECAHCDQVFFDGYRPSQGLVIDVLKCDRCGGYSRFNDSPPEG
jgi:hypothetical protein